METNDSFWNAIDRICLLYTSILRTGLMHGLSQSEHTGGEIFGKKMNDQSRNQNSHGKYEHTDSQNPFNADIA